MASFEPARVYSTNVYESRVDPDGLTTIRQELRTFIEQFRLLNDEYIYREQLIRNVLARKFNLTVDMTHLINYSNTLGFRVSRQPGEVLPLFEQAAKQLAREIVFVSEKEADEFQMPDIQILLTSDMREISIRELHARYISRIVKVPGIIISSSTPSAKATDLQLICRECRHTLRYHVPAGIAGLQLPAKCQGESVNGEPKNCPSDPYVIVHDKSEFIDQQVLKLQESPEMVPVGEMPRSIPLSVDRTLVNRLVPGRRCSIIGIYSIFQSKAKAPGAVAIRNPYIRVVGMSTFNTDDRENPTHTAQEEQEMLELSRRPDIFEAFANSIAPSIYGHEDIKKSIACLLVGGSRRILPDGMRLRGDINVLLMGDPGTAKSQLLKFVEKVAPIAIYTSGKGSSAAGLTASVQRDPATRDFYLEGGAMVLADGGVVCIDEFDKMRDEDRVAIHEAMEQQTISIAKAGITTVLNSRTSVLAAANPVYGRYDSAKSPGENIDFQTTILSRFDMIYVIRDEHNDKFDRRVAHHVLNTHVKGSNAAREMEEGEISLDLMKRYVSYCRTKCAPRLSPRAAQSLVSDYIAFRSEMQEREASTDVRSSVPITVRQLEALVRISESIAKLKLKPQVEEAEVEEAIRLFRASTLNAVRQEVGSAKIAEEISRITDEIKRRLKRGYKTSYVKMLNDFGSRFNCSRFGLDQALHKLERMGTVTFLNQRQDVYRCGP